MSDHHANVSFPARETAPTSVLRSFLRSIVVLGALVACAPLLPAPSLPAQEDDGCCDTPDPESVKEVAAALPAPALALPDVAVIDQTGTTRRFASELVGDRTVVIGFFFTRCTTICPPLTATMAQLQDRLRAAGHEEVALLSISLDPAHDTPARLASWAKTFGADPGWSFLTGEKTDIDTILEHFGVAVSRPEDHAPILLVGNAGTGTWRREYALAPAAELEKVVTDVVVAAATAKEATEPTDGRPVNAAAHGYFTDLPIVDQTGATHRLYTDLIRGRTVVVSCFFSTCAGICPPMHRNLLEIANTFEERVGKDLFFLCVTVDPETDSVETLAHFAEGLGVGKGWHFLTGTRAQVDPVLAKFGLTTEAKENHKGVFLIGNDRTALWEKAFGLGSPEDLIPIVERVLEDRGVESSAVRSPAPTDAATPR